MSSGAVGPLDLVEDGEELGSGGRYLEPELVEDVPVVHEARGSPEAIGMQKWRCRRRCPGRHREVGIVLELGHAPWRSASLPAWW